MPDIWYQVRKNIGDIRHTLPAGVVGPGFNDDFGDTFGSSTASPPTASHIASCATMSRISAHACCRFPTYQRSMSSARRTSRSTSSFRRSNWPVSVLTGRR